MTEQSPWAHHVRGTAKDTEFYVVYPARVTPQAVAPLASRLNRTPDIQARIETAVTSGMGPRAVVVLRIVTTQKAALRTAGLIKTLTRPDWPITVRHMVVSVRICGCGTSTAAIKLVEFVAGFEPASATAFRERCLQAMQRLPLAQLANAQLKPPHAPLLKAFYGVLNGAGAHVMALRVELRTKGVRCTHRR